MGRKGIPINLEATRKAYKKALKVKKYNQIAKECMVSVSTVTNWVNGKTMPSNQTAIDLLAMALDVPVASIAMIGNLEPVPTTSTSPVKPPSRIETTVRAGEGVSKVRAVPEPSIPPAMRKPPMISTELLDSLARDTRKAQNTSQFLSRLVDHLPALCNDAQLCIVNHILKGE